MTLSSGATREAASKIAENFYLYKLELSAPELVAPALQSASKGTAHVE